jgi:hypothetical protein
MHKRSPPAAKRSPSVQFAPMVPIRPPFLEPRLRLPHSDDFRSHRRYDTPRISAPDNSSLHVDGALTHRSKILCRKAPRRASDCSIRSRRTLRFLRLHRPPKSKQNHPFSALPTAHRCMAKLRHGHLSPRIVNGVYVPARCDWRMFPQGLVHLVIRSLSPRPGRKRVTLTLHWVERRRTQGRAALARLRLSALVPGTRRRAPLRPANRHTNISF